MNSQLWQVLPVPCQAIPSHSFLNNHERILKSHPVYSYGWKCNLFNSHQGEAPAKIPTSFPPTNHLLPPCPQALSPPVSRSGTNVGVEHTIQCSVEPSKQTLFLKAISSPHSPGIRSAALWPNPSQRGSQGQLLALLRRLPSVLSTNSLSRPGNVTGPLLCPH